jgi:hypothetical protein
VHLPGVAPEPLGEWDTLQRLICGLWTGPTGNAELPGVAAVVAAKVARSRGGRKTKRRSSNHPSWGRVTMVGAHCAMIAVTVHA